MAYHGLVPTIKQYMGKLDHAPAVLEVGIDRGATCLPLVVHMASKWNNFMFFGIDIRIPDSLKVTLGNMDATIPDRTWLLEQNSLQALPRILKEKILFDVILLDGDHNYHTVSQELPILAQLLQPAGMLVVDDYDGKWSERDMFYSEREGYEGTGATPRIELDRQGVKVAVDDFLSSTPGWKLLKVIKGEPVLLVREAYLVPLKENSNDNE